MTLSIALDLIAFGATAVALRVLYTSGRAGFSRETFYMLIGLVCLTMLRNLGNILQFGAGLAILETMEAYWEVLLPLAFLFTFSSIIRDRRLSQIGQSERRYRSFVENFRGIAFRTTLDAEPIFLDGAVEEITGCDSEHLISGHVRWGDLIHEEDRPNTQVQNTKLLLVPGNSREIDYRIRRPDGQIRWVRDNATHVQAPPGGEATIEGTIIDTTEKKKLEDQLHHVQKLDAIGQLAGGIAHDFNNNLTGMLGFAELIRDEVQDETLKGYAESILRSARHSADLTKQLLAFARRGKSQSVPLRVSELVENVINLLKRSIDRQVSIHANFGDESLMTIGDPAMLESAILNVAINARDAIGESGRIDFETRLVDLKPEFCLKHQNDIEPGPYIQLSITDTGCGMTREIRQKVFEPFFTTKPQGKGTGMGLSAVFGTIKEHKGAIDVYSEPGVGTTLKLYLPFTPELQPSFSSPEEVIPDRQTRQILLVDDEEIVRDLATAMLSKLGFSVVLAKDGVEATAIYRERWREIDLVIIDMIMPQVGGREAFAEMKKVNPEVKGLLSSGFGMNSQVQEALKNGIHGFLQKPFEIRELSRAVQSVLSSNQ